MTLKHIVCIFFLFQSFVFSAQVKPGLDVFLNSYAHLVRGKRVGLITNQTGVTSGLTQNIDLFFKNRNINLVALFAPEHGIRGDLKAGEHVKNGRDKKTGLPVYSLYGGRDHRPQKAHLAKIDVMIYDIQDVGSRAYTFIWTMAEAMAACAANGKEFIVLDRPDPYGGTVVDGTISEKKWLSFIGLYPIPRVYGMTPGELARFLKYEFKINCKLQVIPMRNYKRGLPWAYTQLQWVPPSPNIPTVDSALCFAATGALGELSLVHTGVGGTLPFQVVVAPWMNAQRIAALMNNLKLPGVKFRAYTFKPKNSVYGNVMLKGFQIHVIDSRIFRPASTEVAIIWALRKYYPKNFNMNSATTRKKWQIFDKAMGTSSVRIKLLRGESYYNIIDGWIPKLKRFNKKRMKYLIYQ